jgi:RNA polymerase sigma factor (sigma-70 family)
MQTQNQQSHFNVSDLLATIHGIKSQPQVTEKYVTDQLTYRLGRLRSKFSLSRPDMDDVRQDFLLSLVRGIKNYQPEKGSWRTFITAIFDNCYRYQLRKLTVNERLVARNTVSLDEFDEEYDLTPSYVQDNETALDVKMAIAIMTPPLQHVAGLLKTHSPAETARSLHVSKSTISRFIKKIREHFLSMGFEPRLYGCNDLATSANK